jgi:tetratricopeptide (TPR) repeat protein
LLFIGDFNKSQIILTKTIKQAPKNQFNHWINAQLHIQTGDLLLAKRSFERIAKMGGRYTLPAKVNLAVLNKDELQLGPLLQQLEREIQTGNQWAELVYSKGLIMLAQNNIPTAISTFEKAIKAGMNHSYRFKNHPLMKDISASPEFKNLLTLLELKNQQQRQQVIKLEHLDDL